MNGDKYCPINPLETHIVYAKGIWPQYPRGYLLTSPEPLASWRISSSNWTAPWRKFKSTQIYLNNSTMPLLGLMRKCQA
jgi:hypothetical protein